MVLIETSNKSRTYFDGGFFFGGSADARNACRNSSKFCPLWITEIYNCYSLLLQYNTYNNHSQYRYNKVIQHNIT